MDPRRAALAAGAAATTAAAVDRARPGSTCTCAPRESAPATPRPRGVPQIATCHAPAAPAHVGAHRDDPLSFVRPRMELLGNRWSTAVLAPRSSARAGSATSNAHLGIPPVILADRLRRFVDLGVFRRVVYDSRYGRASTDSPRRTGVLRRRGAAVPLGRAVAPAGRRRRRHRHRRVRPSLEPVLRCDRLPGRLAARTAPLPALAPPPDRVGAAGTRSRRSARPARPPTSGRPSSRPRSPPAASPARPRRRRCRRALGAGRWTPSPAARRRRPRRQVGDLVRRGTRRTPESRPRVEVGRVGEPAPRADVDGAPARPAAVSYRDRS